MAEFNDALYKAIIHEATRRYKRKQYPGKSVGYCIAIVAYEYHKYGIVR